MDVRLKRGRIPIVFIFFLLALWPVSAAAQGPSLPIRSIDIRGIRRVEEPTVRFYISTRVGDPFSVPKLRRDIKKIYDLGFFRDVKVDVAPFEGGLRVVFIVEEKPSIASVPRKGDRDRTIHFESGNRTGNRRVHPQPVPRKGLLLRPD
jgi:outer membrane protein insertion porin family